MLLLKICLIDFQIILIDLVKQYLVEMNILVVVYTIVSFGLAVASASGNAPVLMFFQNE
jgi:hypothetical protein